MSDISLTLEQDTALFELRTWFVDKLAPFWRLKGFAGTGKTSLMKFLLACDDFRTNKGIAVVAYTHVAAGVLRKKGVHQATTIHSLVYKAVETPNGDFIYDRRPKAEIADMYSLIVVDEASMVAKPMRKDIESFGVPVLYVGDGGQLPPISDDPEDRDFMVNAESQLIEIHRNAGPIAWLAADVRAGKRIEFGKYGDGVFIIRDHELEDEVLLMSDQIIVGKNDTRRDYNRYIRKLKGYKVNNFPAYDERIMVLENMRDLGIYNGMVLTSRQNNNDLHMYKDVGVKAPGPPA
jgi:exodeoxyribonuclease-5